VRLRAAGEELVVVSPIMVLGVKLECRFPCLELRPREITDSGGYQAIVHLDFSNEFDRQWVLRL